MEPSTKRSRTETDGSFELFSTLCNVVHGIPELVERQRVSAGSEIEVEVRVGMLVEGGRRMYHQVHQPLVCRIFDDLNRGYAGYEFKPGIDEDTVDRIRKSLGERCKETKLLQVQYIDQNRNRWEMSDDSTITSIPEKKTHCYRADLALLGHAYDIRVDVAVESVEDVARKINPEKWVLKRIKKRSTFRADKAFWRVDITEVESVSNTSSGIQQGSEAKEVELEFELEQAALALFTSQSEGTRAEMTKAIVMELLRLIELCIPANLNLPADAKLLPGDNRLLALIQAESQKIAANVFIGAMPVNISRRNLQHIIKNPCFVTEKSDGSRKLLFVVNNPSNSAPVACVIDRARTVERLEGSDVLGAALQLGTILDGELVFNLSHGRHVFLVFDVLCYGGRKLYEKPFSERLQVLRNDVIPTVNKLAVNSTCTPIVLKIFHDKRKIAELMSRIKLVNGRDRIFIDPLSNGYRHHRTDGLIFQPDAPYCFGTDVNLIKWKYADLMSVDLQVTEDGFHEIRLASMGPENMLIDCTQRAPGIPAFGKFTNYRLKADLMYLREERMRSKNSHPLIAEVAFNPVFGVWNYFHFREDKVEPNHINTVISVFIEQAEKIELEELEYRLLARDESENDFSEQMAKMRLKALEFQRSRTSVHASKK